MAAILSWPQCVKPQVGQRANFDLIRWILGWGLLSQFPPFRYFPKFSSLSKHTLTVKYRVYIWQVSPQLSCGDTCQIWMWFEESNMYFCEIENFAYGEINERSFSNPHPRSLLVEAKDCGLFGTHTCWHVDLVSIRPWEMNSKEILPKIQTFSLKTHFKWCWQYGSGAFMFFILIYMTKLE